jgi:hypothetical protein
MYEKLMVSRKANKRIRNTKRIRINFQMPEGTNFPPVHLPEVHRAGPPADLRAEDFFPAAEAVVAAEVAVVDADG